MTSTVVRSAIVAPRRQGAAHWFRAFGLMLLWNIVRMRLFLPVLIMVQAFTGVGLVLGFSLLYADISATQILYLGTGAVVITLVTVGVVVGPQFIAEQRLSGSYDWFASLPIPRSASAAAWTMFNVLIALPGAAAALIAVELRFDADLSISLLLVPAVVLVLLGGTLVGYAYAHALPEPRTVNLVSQLMIFVIFGFSPIAYPVDNLPDWYAAIQQYLPFQHMGDLVRAGLTNGLVESVTRSFIVLGLWSTLAAVISIRVIGRRT